MNRFALLVCTILLLFFTACSQETTSEAQPTASTQQQAEVSPPAKTSTNAAATPTMPAVNSAPTKPEDTKIGDDKQDEESQPDFMRVDGVMGTVFYVPGNFTRQNESADIGYQYVYYQPDLDMRIEVHEIAPDYKDRVGGYTRILKMESRRGDNGKQAILMLV